MLAQIVLTQIMLTQIKFRTSGEQSQALCNQVGSRYPTPQNFHLTREVMEKSTGKLRAYPREVCGHRVSGEAMDFRDGF